MLHEHTPEQRVLLKASLTDPSAYGAYADSLQEGGNQEAGELISRIVNEGKLEKGNYHWTIPNWKPTLDGHYYHRGSKEEKRDFVHIFDKATGAYHHFSYPREKQEEQPTKLAAMKSPAGGAVVNNQYFPGGKFLPRVLGRIRRVRSSGKVRLSRTDTIEKGYGGLNHHIWTPDETTHTLITGNAWGALADRMQEEGLTEAGEFLARNHHRVNLGPRGSPGSEFNTEKKAVVGYFPSSKAMVIFDPEANTWHTVKEPPEEKITLARKDLPLSAYSYLPRNTLNQESLTHDQIRRIEDAHDLRDNERLTESPSYKNHTTHVSAKIQDVAEFHDALAKKRLTDHHLSEILNDPDGDPELKAVHLFHHAHDEADKFHRHQNNGSNWYEGSIEKLDTYLHHMLSREEPFNPNSKHIPDHPLWGSYDHNTGKTKPGPGLKLAKSVLAFTSGRNDPNNNLHTAMKAIGAGMKVNKNDPFRNIPNVDHEGLQDWLSRATAAFKNTDLFDPDPDLGKVTDKPHNTPAHLKDRVTWGEKYGHFDSDNRGWSSTPMVINRKTHTPIAKRAVDGSYIPYGGLTEKDVHSLKKQGLAKNLDVPNVDSQGRLTPRGWGTYGTTIGKALKRLSTLIDHRGMEGASKFLDSSMDIKGVREYNKYAEKGDLLPEEPVPGSWIFGPKFGPFYKNISGDPYHVTMDVWFTRTMQRLLGSLINAKTGKPHAIPPDDRTRRIYKKATFLAAKKLKVSPASLQAILWYHEKHLYKLFGVPTTSEDFAQVARKEMVRHGFDPKFDPAVGTESR